AVPDKNIVFNDYAFADKSMARNFTAPPYLGIFLNFYKRADLSLVANLASIKIDELGEPHVLANFHVRRNGAEFVHRHTRLSLVMVGSLADKILCITRKTLFPSLTGLLISY